MGSRNDITGDLQQTRAPSKKLLNSLENSGELKSVEQRRAARGRYRQDPETKKFIHISEYLEKYGDRPREKTTAFFINHFEPFKSLVSDKVISNKRQLQYDLDSNGCRVYEGREQEQKEVDRHLAYEDQKFERTIEEDMHRTYHDIEHGYKEVSDRQDNLTWTWGEE